MEEGKPAAEIYMKLQIGSSRVRGKYRGDEWVNLDIKKFDDVNVLGDGLALPFATGAIDEVHCVHVLEHMIRDKSPTMLGEIHRVLKKGGDCYVEVPDFRATIQWLEAAFRGGDVEAIHNWITSIYGKSEIPGMAHHWGFYEGSLRRAFRQQGFNDVKRLLTKEEMISTHYRQEPILLIRGTK